MQASGFVCPLCGDDRLSDVLDLIMPAGIPSVLRCCVCKCLFTPDEGIPE